MQSKDKTLSRRTLVRAVATGVALTAGVTAATARGKRQQSAVAYQNNAHGHARCEICTSFLPPDQCRTVVGPVDRQAWCNIYAGP
jgi:hypothetical protein